MLIIAILVLGLAAGWVAQLVVTPGRHTDWSRALVAGLAGSFLGGLLASLLAGDGLDLRMSGIIGSSVGAIAVTAVWARTARPTTPARRQSRG